jgi:hypothetical protein
MENKEKHVLSSFNYENIKKIFSENLTLSIVYFLCILIFIIIIFSTNYITISYLISLYFCYLFFHQLYKIYNSKDGEIGYTTIIIPTFLIVVAFIVNYIIPIKETINDYTKNPKMEGSVIVIIYSTIIYSILFLFFLIYNTYKNNKYLLLGISIFFIITYILYAINKNYFSVNKKNTPFINILLITPCFFSIIHIIFMFAYNLKPMVEAGFPNGTTNLLYNNNYVEKTKENIFNNPPSINEIFINILIICYYFILFVCFIIFLVSANQTSSKCNISDYPVYVINAIIIIILLYFTIEMTNRGKLEMGVKSINERINLPINLHNYKMDMKIENNSTLFFLIIYNIFISKFFNDDCFSIMNKFFNDDSFSITNKFPITNKFSSITNKFSFITNKISSITNKFTSIMNNFPSFIIMISYIITIGIYYKILNSEDNNKNASNILFYFIVLILFIAVILSINTSKLGKMSSFNGAISNYIYSIIAFSIIFGISYIYIYIKSLDSSIKDNEFIKTLTYSLFILFGLFLFLMLINWIITLYNTFTFTKSNVLGLILNVAIIITIMAILFKMITYSSYYKESPLLQVVIGSVFYIPCLFISLLNKITGIYNDNKNNISSDWFKFNRTDLLLLIIIIVLYILYYNFTNMYTKYSSQNGQILLKEPLNTNTKKLLSSYYSLSSANKSLHSYNYGLSCWLFIDGNNTNDKFYSLIDFGGKPNIQYRGIDNTFMITIDTQLVNAKEKEILDEFGNIIMYKNTDLLLQKWNNIIVNYNSGILDIFINGELIQSFKGELPYMKKDNITSGDNNGIRGGICNVVYFDKSLNFVQIQNVYNSVKNLNPPILLNFYDKLYIDSLKVENITHMMGLNQIDPNQYLTISV